MKFKTLKTFDTAIAAHILRNRLESEDITCHIFDENIVTLNPMLNFAVGGIRLQVAETDFLKAKEILTEIETTPLIDEQNESIKCPTCASTELYSDFKSYKRPREILAFIVAFLVIAFPIFSKSVYKCKECGTEFEPK